ncbi:MAG: ATP-binding protein [Caldilineaceae bacterium]|nr:ATP-binding protein [Caldilineaceae bacterium]
MENTKELRREIETLRERLSRLTEASLRINQDLDFDAVLQGVLDSACSLSRARYGVLTLLDEGGQAADYLSSGMTPAEAQRLWELPGGLKLFEHLSSIPEPLRLRDLIAHIRSLGLPEPVLPAGAGSPAAFLTAPIHHGEERVGSFFLAGTESDRTFTAEDEEALVIFAGQAALVIANARRFRDERRARDELETLINTSPIGVVVFDAKAGIASSFNREAKRIAAGLQASGLSPEQVLEVVTYRRADGEEIVLSELPLAQALSRGETVRLEEIVLQVPDGGRVKVLVNATPIFSDEGEVESFVVTVQDMAPLEEIERLRAEFMDMVIHELRTPLTSIKGSATTLLEESSSLDPTEMRQFHRIISDQSDHMRGLLTDLLDMARIDTGTLPVSPQPSDTASLVDEARILFADTGYRHSIQIDVAPDLPQIMADRRRIVHVLSNLLANAARHSSELSTIRVKAAREQLQVVVSVADEGRGIPAERLPLLFRKVSRFEGEDGKQRGALAESGLRLSICRGIVEAHGGRIWAESDGLGEGARFIFTIPVVEREEPGAAGASAPGAGSGEAGAERTRILAVVGNPYALMYIRDALVRTGYEPIITGEPEEMDRLIEEKRPDLVLLDMTLPGTDAIELLRGVLEKTELPVIFFSAYGQEGVMAQAFDMGAVDYVTQPFSPTELAARIRTALRRRSGAGPFMKRENFVLGELVINYAKRRVSVAGRPIALTATEYALLFELSTNAGLVMTHDQLLRRVWGEGHSGDAGLVRTVVQRLRHKLGEDAHNPTFIFTEHRVGYFLVSEERRA